MRQIYEKKAVVLDCDGVVLDSNFMKISSMRKAIESQNEVTDGVEKAVTYFRKNFGLSRFHHAKYFVNECLLFSGVTESQLFERILEKYGQLVEEQYAS